MAADYISKNMPNKELDLEESEKIMIVYKFIQTPIETFQ